MANKCLILPSFITSPLQHYKYTSHKVIDQEALEPCAEPASHLAAEPVLIS